MDASQENGAKTYNEHREPSYGNPGKYKTRYGSLRRQNNNKPDAMGIHMEFQGFRWTKHKIPGGIELKITPFHQEQLTQRPKQNNTQSVH